MPSFGAASLSRLATLTEDLKHLCKLVITQIDFSITSGHRTLEEQAALYAQGRETPGRIVTWAKPGESIHNLFPSQAVDVAPWPIDWRNEGRFYELIGAFIYVSRVEGIELEFGAHWPKKKRDLPHIQMKQGG